MPTRSFGMQESFAVPKTRSLEENEWLFSETLEKI